jgi:hypothetical protein
VAEPGQLTCVASTRQRAGQDLHKRLTGRDLPQPSRCAPACLGQWDVGRAGMLAADTPGCLAMPYEDHASLLAAAAWERYRSACCAS